MRIYFDNCCYNRPFDDRLTGSVEAEALAIFALLARCMSGLDDLCASEIIDEEIAALSHEGRRKDVGNLRALARYWTRLPDDSASREAELASAGVKFKDAQHVVCAETLDCDVLVTTDRRLLRAAKRFSSPVRLVNPVDLVAEIK